MQRLRVKHTRGNPLKYISHLDMMRLWERALRRGAIPVAYSEGFSPHPRISLAAPLPIGVTSEAELMDVVLKRPLSPAFFMQRMRPQMPTGIDILELEQIPLTAPSLQSQAQLIEYKVVTKATLPAAQVESGISGFLKARDFPWHHVRDTGPRHYDLRRLVDAMSLVSWSEQSINIFMRLRCDAGGTGRPEQVALALGLTDPPLSVHRTRLILSRN